MVCSMFESSEPKTVVGTPVVDAELAWDLADIARSHLDATRRNDIYIAIAVGDAFWAIKLLLSTLVRFELGVRADLLPKLLGLLTSYRDHPDQARLRHLIGRVRIQPVAPPERFAPRHRPQIRTVSQRLHALRPVVRRARPGDPRRVPRQEVRVNGMNRQPSAQQRTGSFGYE
jgi:hypothetical protein